MLRDKSKTALIVILAIIVFAALFEGLSYASMNRWMFVGQASEDRSVAPIQANGASATEGPDAALPASDIAQDGGSTQLPVDKNYAYSQLNTEDQAKYDIVLDVLETRSKAAYPDGAADDLERIRDCVLADHPELFYVSGIQASMTKNLITGAISGTTIEGSYAYSPDEALDILQNAEEVASACLADAPVGADDFAKAKYVYEYLAHHVAYDHESASSPAFVDAAGTRPAHQTIEGALIEGKAVCGGYASAFQFLMQHLGIPCTYVTGVANAERHSWCLVLLDGSYYYVDPTWGDPQYFDDDGSVSGTDDLVNYDYLGLSTADLEIDHVIESPFALPECTAIRDNYYIHEGLFFNWPDIPRFEQLVTDAAGNGETVQIRCASDEAFGALLDETVTNGDLSWYIPSGSYQYSYSVPFRTITVIPAS